MIKRFDLGWTTTGGGFDFISAPDGALTTELRIALLKWADSTRDHFEQHFFWGYLDQAHLALVRVSPLLGSMRGGSASTVQAIVLDEDQLIWCQSVEYLVNSLPEAPCEIGKASKWGVLPEISTANNKKKLVQNNAFWQALGVLVANVAAGTPVTLHYGANLDSPQTEIQLLMCMFANLPAHTHRLYKPRFATCTAPNDYETTFRISTTSGAVAGSREAQLYCALLRSAEIFDLQLLPDIQVDTQLRAALKQCLADKSSSAGAGMHAADHFVQFVKVVSEVDVGMRSTILDLVPVAINAFESAHRAKWLRELLQSLRLKPIEGFPQLWIYKLYLRPENIQQLKPSEQIQLLEQVLRRMPKQISQNLMDMPAASLGFAIDAVVRVLGDDIGNGCDDLSEDQMETIGMIGCKIANNRPSYDLPVLAKVRDVASKLANESDNHRDIKGIQHRVGISLIQALCTNQDGFTGLLRAGMQVADTKTSLHPLGFIDKVAQNNPNARSLRIAQLSNAICQLVNQGWAAQIKTSSIAEPMTTTATIPAAEFLMRLAAKIPSHRKHSISQNSL